MPWPKGKKRVTKTPGSGRKPGAQNQRTKEAQEVAAAIIDDPDVQKRWLTQAQAGELSGTILQTLMYYRWGRPVERHEHSGINGGPLQVALMDYSKDA